MIHSIIKAQKEETKIASGEIPCVQSQGQCLLKTKILDHVDSFYVLFSGYTQYVPIRNDAQRPLVAFLKIYDPIFLI